MDKIRGVAGTMKKSRKRFLFTLCGQTGATGLSLVTLWLALWSESPSPAFFGWATLALMVFRVTVRLSNGPKPILESDQVVRHARRVLSTEVAIATMFICAAFLLGWPLTRQAALAFFGLNLAAQLVKLLAVRVVLTYMQIGRAHV